MTLATDPSQPSSLQMPIDDLLPAEKELAIPLGKDEIVAKYSGHKMAGHPYVKDGIFYSENIPQAEAGKVFKAIFVAVDRVKDEHFPQMGFMGASFLRLMAVTEVPRPEQPSILKVDLYFRFTIDNCPAGERSFLKVMSEVAMGLNKDTSYSMDRLDIHVLHGGTPHSSSDVNDPVFRALFVSRETQCDPACGDLKRGLLARIPKA